MKDKLSPKDDYTPKYRYIRPKKVLELVPFSKATLWRKVADGTFVKPIKLSTRVTAFDSAAIQAWLDSKEGC